MHCFPGGCGHIVDLALAVAEMIIRAAMRGHRPQLQVPSLARW